MTIQCARRVILRRGRVSGSTWRLAGVRQPTVACAPMGSSWRGIRGPNGTTRTNATPRRARVPVMLRAAAAILGIATPPALAQGVAGPEARLDILVGRSAALHVGAALGLRTGLYVRPMVVVAAGPAWLNDTARASGRVEALARFVLDPFRESQVGMYAQGGLTALYDPWDRWRGALSVAVGAELPARAGGVWAVEVGLGGGVRFGLALRRAAPGRR